MTGCGDGPSAKRANTCPSAMRHASGSIGEQGPRALEVADEEGVDGHQVAGVSGLDGAFADRGREPLQQADLLVDELNPALGGGLLQPEQPLLTGQREHTPCTSPEEAWMPSRPRTCPR